MGLFNLGFSFGHKNEKQTQSVDKETADWMRQIWGAGQSAGNAGPSPLLTGAGNYGSAAQAGGNTGLAALGGDRGAVQQLMNPYTQQVIDQNNAGWNQINQQTANQINDQATQAHAFGGSRQGVAQGVALAQNNLAQAQQNAGLLSQGYQQAQGQAAQLAGLGFQGADLGSNLGLNGVGSPDQWRLAMLKQGFVGPLGSTSNSKSSGWGFNAGLGGK